MSRFLTILFLSLLATLARADDFENADKAWSSGKPWPAHWGLVQHPYEEGWNVVLIAFVNKVYAANEAAGTWLKHIPYAQGKDASVEVCMFKRGLFKLSTICKAAVVDPEIAGTLREDDIVAFFYPNHGTRGISKGPGSDARTTMRVFQKLTSGDDAQCWESVLIIHAPTARACFDKIDRGTIERILTRDFGPRNGLQATPAAVPLEAERGGTVLEPAAASVAPVSAVPAPEPADTPIAADTRVLNGQDQATVSRSEGANPSLQ